MNIKSHTTYLCTELTEEKDRGGGYPSPLNLSNGRTVPLGLTLDAYTETTQLPIEDLRGMEISEVFIVDRRMLRIRYLSESGAEVSVRFQKAVHGDNRFQWRKGAKPSLYGQWRLNTAREATFVVIVESEADCHTMWHHGYPCVAIPADETWNEGWASLLAGVEVIYVATAATQRNGINNHWLADSALRNRARLLTLPSHATLTALHITDAANFTCVIQDALERATPWLDIQEVKQANAAHEALTLSAGLLEDPHVLDRIAEFMTADGFAGDCTAPLLAYVAITSRLLERPMNLVFVAPSSAGKNRAIDAAVGCVPEDAVYALAASSERALIYTDETFSHRMIVMKEADSLPDDGPAAAALRSIAADNRMVYEVTERSAATGQYGTRRVVKEGPTGLLTTSTKSLEWQLGTRHLEVGVPDDPQQTRQVMRAHADAVSGKLSARLDPEPFLAMQRWLALAPRRKVIVPFSSALADLMNSTEVRMRRDFRQLLTCIQTIALLRQRQGNRLRDDVVIVAHISDYAEARRLLASIFNTLSAAGVSSIIRETVGAVAPFEEVSEAQLAERLGLARSTISYRVRKALDGGWLENREQRTGCPARLVRGVPLPELIVALPDPAAVQKLFESQCTLVTRESLVPSEHEL